MHLKVLIVKFKTPDNHNPVNRGSIVNKCSIIQDNSQKISWVKFHPKGNFVILFIILTTGSNDFFSTLTHCCPAALFAASFKKKIR